MTMRRRWLWLGALAGAYAFANHLGRTWGSTPEERASRMESDDLVPDAEIRSDHAVTIRGTGEQVWPWLLQMGWHRGGWYTYRWVDRLLFPANRPSAESILPEYQGLAVGDQIPDGAPETGTYFVVETMEPGRLMVLRSRTHLPPRPKDARLDWVWTYRLEPVGEDRVRLHLRTRGSLAPAWLSLAYRSMTWMDFVMARSHLLGIKQRVERV